MNQSPGFGQAGPGQPDFDGPAGEPQPTANLAGWTHVAGPQGNDGAAGRPDPENQGYPEQQGYPQHHGYPGKQGYPQHQGYPEQQGNPEHQGYPQQGDVHQTQPSVAPRNLGQPPAWQQGVTPPPAQAGGAYQPTIPLPTYQPTGPLPGSYPPRQQQSPPQQQPPPRPAGRPWRGYVLTGAIIVALIAGLLSWQFLSPMLAGQPTAGSSASAPTSAAASPTSAAASPTGSPQPTVVRTSPATQPTNSTPVSGGEIGQSVEFTTTGGTGTVTVTGAAWADNGILEPDDGSSYLIVNVTFKGVSGSISTGPFFTSVTDADDNAHMMTIGAALEQQLGMRTLRAGEQNSGQLAFELPRGPVTFAVHDELLESLATIDLPG